MERRNDIPCAIFRGGTSKGLYFLEKDIPPMGEERDRFLLSAMGSPDVKQIDGLGGAASVTSKVAIIRPSDRADADVDYTFAQVSVDKPVVSYKGNCGNISSGVGPFAIEKGLVEAREPVTEVRIFNTNTEKLIVEEVQVKDGRVLYQGDMRIPGVPGCASPVKLKFLNPAGTISDRLLPTKHPVDLLTLENGTAVEVSIVDAANPLVFVRAEDVRMRGTELPGEIDGNPELLNLLEQVRAAAAVKLGLIDDPVTSAWKSPTVPKLTIVAPPADYLASDGTPIQKSDIDLTARMMSMQKAHPTYAMTGAMCTAAAAAVEGSVVALCMGPWRKRGELKIGHPGGVLIAGVDYEKQEEEPAIHCTYGYRTANFLMDGKLISAADAIERNAHYLGQ